MAKSQIPFTKEPSESKPWFTPQTLAEYRMGYPHATQEQIQMLMDAEEKLGYPPKSLKEAEAVLAR